MPRKAKTENGYPAQVRPNIPPQTYGEGKPMTDMTAAMPAPNAHAAPAAAAPVAAPVEQPVQQPVEQAPPQALMDIARQMAGGSGLLAAPTTRPNEALTAGLPSGPGPGPEIMPKLRGNPTIELLERLSMETKDPYFAGLALRVRG